MTILDQSAETDFLVSVVVFTYQSEATILETLGSIYNQTYQRLELVVSDDASTDQTNEIVEQWLKANQSRFVQTLHVLTKDGVNRGTASNANQGVLASSGRYIRLIAGDDMLTPDSISVCLRQAQTNGSDWIAGRVEIIGDMGKEENARIANRLNNTQEENLQLPIHKQYRRLMADNFFIAVGSNFFSRKMYNAIGGYNRKYPLLEDYPFYLRAYQLGFYPMYIPVTIAYYRVHSRSLTHKKQGERSAHIRDLKHFFVSVRLWLLLQSLQWKTCFDQIRYYCKL